MKYSFPYNEHLKSRKAISLLFAKGKTINIFPVRTLWSVSHEQDFYAKCTFSVSSKKFKRAVDRNKIKRLMRESYRLNKHIITGHLVENNVKISLIFIYTGNSMPCFSEIEEKIIVTLQNLKKLC